LGLPHKISRPYIKWLPSDKLEMWLQLLGYDSMPCRRFGDHCYRPEHGEARMTETSTLQPTSTGATTELNYRDNLTCSMTVLCSVIE